MRYIKTIAVMAVVAFCVVGTIWSSKTRRESPAVILNEGDVLLTCKGTYLARREVRINYSKVPMSLRRFVMPLTPITQDACFTSDEEGKHELWAVKRKDSPNVWISIDISDQEDTTFYMFSEK